MGHCQAVGEICVQVDVLDGKEPVERKSKSEKTKL